MNSLYQAPFDLDTNFSKRLCLYNYWPYIDIILKSNRSYCVHN